MVSVSFNIASELLAAANDEQLSEDELIGLVLGFTIVFTALQARLSSELGKRKFRVVADAKKAARARGRGAPKGKLQRSKDSSSSDATLSSNWRCSSSWTKSSRSHSSTRPGAPRWTRLADRRSMLDFLYLLVSICQRITVAISVQLLAASVRRSSRAGWCAPSR